MDVGARSAAAAPFRLLQVLEVDHGEGRRLTRRIRRSKFDEAKLQRFGQQAGSRFKCLGSLNSAENVGNGVRTFRKFPRNSLVACSSLEVTHKGLGKDFC